jgi:hypothetical protein
MATAPTGSHGSVKVLMHELGLDGRDGRYDGTTVCCQCAYCEPLPTTAQCRCTHPSSEFKDGVTFSGAPTCAAFVPRHGTRHGMFDGQGGVSWLHGS